MRAYRAKNIARPGPGWANDNAPLRTRGWRDMIGTITLPGTDIGDPVRENIGASGYKAYKFDIGKNYQIDYHLQHDFVLTSDVYLHVHWLTDGVDTHAVNWQFTYNYARGFGQQAFSLAEPVVTIAEAPSGIAFTHMTSEITVPISDPSFEPDGIMMVVLQRISNGGVDNADKVFVLTADAHYQTMMPATKNRQPNFFFP